MYICILKQNTMLSINELLKYDFKKIDVYKKLNGKVVYDVEMSSKETGNMIHPILHGVSKIEWDLNFMVIRLFDELSLNDVQCEHLLNAIEDYGQERFEAGSRDDY